MADNKETLKGRVTVAELRERLEELDDTETIALYTNHLGEVALCTVSAQERFNPVWENLD